MIKKICTMTAIAIGSFIGFAIPAFAATNINSHQGFYIGVGAGKNTTRYDFTNSPSTGNNFNHKEKNTVGEIFGGYGFQLGNRGYLGLEAFVAGNSSNSDTTVASGVTYKTQIKNTVGVSVLPGVFVTPNTLLYARLGLVASDFDVQASTTPVAVFKESGARAGGQVGLGIDYYVSKNMSIGAEYDYTAYQKITAGPSELKIKNDQVLVRAAYHFA